MNSYEDHAKIKFLPANYLHENIARDIASGLEIHDCAGTLTIDKPPSWKMKLFVTAYGRKNGYGKKEWIAEYRKSKWRGCRIGSIGEARYIKLRVLQVSKSNSHDVTLVNVARELTGTYKCEVSAGSPSYHTGIQRAKMEVVGKYVRMSTLKISFLIWSKINCSFRNCPKYIYTSFFVYFSTWFQSG